MKPMLSPTFSSPACSTPSDGTSALRSNPRTFPKQRRNCMTIRQSEKHPPGNSRPAIRDSSGRGCILRETHLHTVFIQEEQFTIRWLCGYYVYVVATVFWMVATRHVFGNAIYHDNEYAQYCYRGHFKIPRIIIHYKLFRILNAF